MKKYIAIFLTLVLVLTLTACGGEETPSGTTPSDTASTGEAPGRETGSVQKPDETEETAPAEEVPFGDYLSEEELLAMLESGDFSAYLSVDPEGPADPVDTGGDEPYSGFSNSIIFTNGGDAEGVEHPDFVSQLSPEMRAEWEELEQALTDPEMMEMFGDMETGD